MPPEMPTGFEGGGGVGIVGALIWLAAYAFGAYCFMLISQKTQRGTPWWAWVPILNAFLALKIADKPWWWILLLLIPFVNFVVAIIVLMKIAEARGKPGWWGILLIVPIVNFVILYMLAFKD